MKSSVRVEGIRELTKRIANLTADLASKNRAVVKREAGEIMRVMKAKAPKDERKLEKAITTRTTSMNSFNSAGVGGFQALPEVSMRKLPSGANTDLLTINHAA